MTTSTLEVGDLLSILGARGIERQLRRVTGVGRVSVNPVSSSTTVVYNPGKTGLAAIQAAIEDCGFHCAGEALPRHVCETQETASKSRRQAPASLVKPAQRHRDILLDQHAGEPTGACKVVEACKKSPVKNVDQAP